MIFRWFSCILGLVMALCLASPACVASPKAEKNSANKERKRGEGSSKRKLDPTKDALVFFVAAPEVILKRGGTANGVVTIKVAEGFHIQANPAKPRLIPTALKLDDHSGVDVTDIQYPKGKDYRLKGSERDISVYEGKVKIKYLVAPKKTAKVGKTHLVGKIRYQACNDITCFFPKSIPVKIPVAIQ